MSSDVENPVAIVESPQLNTLQIVEESEMENDSLIEKKSRVVFLKQISQMSQASVDSDVSLTYEEGSDEKEEDNKEEEKSLAYNYATDSVSDDNGKDSGCEVSGNQESNEKLNENEKSEEEEETFTPPDDELADRIVAQVEFYFSDANITKDAFLLKHVKRNKEGYVSLKLISSFKRVKHLAKDWRVVAYALKRSKKLEVNETQTKLRRVDPLPAFDQTTPSRTVVAINLPTEKPTIESVAEIFRDFGEISLIRILRPGNSVPADVRSFANKHPEMKACISAIVEFERTESAKLAIERLDNDWRSGVQGMKVLELNAPAVAEKKKRVPGKKSVISRVLDGDLSSSCQSGSEAEVESRFLHRRSSSPHPMRGADIPRLQRRYSANRDLGTNYINPELYREKPPCACCNHCDKRYYSSGSGYDSPVPVANFRMMSLKEPHENCYQIPAARRFSGVDGACCFLRRGSRDSGSESSGSFTRAQEFGRMLSRDSISSNEGGFPRRFSRDSISSDSVGSYRRLSKDSVSSDIFAPPFLTRSNSRDIIDLPRRSSFGAINTFDRPRPLVNSGSRSYFTIPSHCSNTHSPHIPENVVRMPKGPDGSKGFVVAQ